jgi:hypothetical protein
MCSRTRLIAAAVGFACLPGMALAATADTPRIGAATGLKGQVSATIDSQPSHAVKSGEQVFGGERIKTGAASSMVVQFLDNSTFQIGPNADVVINPSQVKPVAGSAVRSMTVDSGAFRAIAALTSVNSQTILSTSVGAFATGAGVVVGEVSPQRIAIFPIDGPGTFVYSTKSLTVPKGGALIADIATGTARVVTATAADPATTALMADAMAQLGGPATATAGAAPVGYVMQPVAGIATTGDGYIDAMGGTQSKEEIPPETQVAAVAPTPPNLGPPTPPAPPPPPHFPPPPMPPAPPASPP